MPGSRHWTNLQPSRLVMLVDNEIRLIYQGTGQQALVRH